MRHNKKSILYQYFVHIIFTQNDAQKIFERVLKLLIIDISNKSKIIGNTSEKYNIIQITLNLNYKKWQTSTPLLDNLPLLS